MNYIDYTQCFENHEYLMRFILSHSGVDRNECSFFLGGGGGGGGEPPRGGNAHPGNVWIFGAGKCNFPPSDEFLNKLT